MVSVMNLAPLLWTSTMSHSIERSVSMIGAKCSYASTAPYLGSMPCF